MSKKVSQKLSDKIQMMIGNSVYDWVGDAIHCDIYNGKISKMIRDAVGEELAKQRTRTAKTKQTRRVPTRAKTQRRTRSQAQSRVNGSPTNE